MSNYTPTTEEIRNEFYEAYANNSLPLEFSGKFVTRRFDDWLEQHDKEVASATKQRIIKLLEDEAFTKAFGRSKDFNAKRANLIALIKGENK